MGTKEWDRYRATYDWGGLGVQSLVRREFPKDSEIMDVGACWGKYRDLLPEYPNMDACEVWEPYIEGERLVARYRHVYMEDIFDLVYSPRWHPYDLVIMGDVLEHLERPRARAVVEKVLKTCGEILVVVPFEYPQDEEDGNPYQRHLQDDLTVDLMDREYPWLQRVGVEYQQHLPFKGLYRRKK